MDRLSAERGVPTVDPEPVLDGMWGDLVWADFIHPSSLGYRTIAGLAVEAILSEGMMGLDCGDK